MHSLLLSSGLIIRGIRTEIATVRTLERRNSRFILAQDPNFTFTHHNHLAKVVKKTKYTKRAENSVFRQKNAKN